MRPLRRLPIDEDVIAQQPVSALLMAAFGPFCMLSERPVPSQTYVWHAGRAEEATGEQASAEDWNDLFLLDEATYNAVAEIREPQDLLLPDRSATFNLEGGPFSYTLDHVPTTYLDEEGQPEGDPVMEEHALVHGMTPEAERTIAAFALNSIYFDPEKGELNIPRDEFLRMTDHRLHERTTAWRRAQQMLEMVREGQERDGPFHSFLDQIRLTVGATGYWSVWATVLWQGTEDKELVRRVLFEPREEEEKRTELLKTLEEAPPHEFTGAGPHNAFPGTHTDWLDRV